MNRFTLRGKTKVNAQWLMYCMVYNIEKIATQGQQCRSRRALTCRGHGLSSKE
ncbi:transposase [Nitrincola nitratireducens]|uniref:transposase n=1 Tax=Nitrincola nitratireducens TaxID=1229521 RepID=UPI000B7AF41D